MLIFLGILCGYFLLMNCIAMIAAVLDKKRAQRHQWRIAETRLMWLGALGGALGEWIVMRKIRHKTTRKKFMIGLPLFCLLHCILIATGLFCYFSFYA